MEAVLGRPNDLIRARKKPLRMQWPYISCPRDKARAGESLKSSAGGRWGSDRKSVRWRSGVRGRTESLAAPKTRVAAERPVSVDSGPWRPISVVRTSRSGHEKSHCDAVAVHQLPQGQGTRWGKFENYARRQIRGRPDVRPPKVGRPRKSGVAGRTGDMSGCRTSGIGRFRTMEAVFGRPDVPVRARKKPLRCSGRTWSRLRDKVRAGESLKSTPAGKSGVDRTDVR